MENKILTLRTIIKKDGKYYHGFVPSLSGCHTQGKTIEETRKNLRKAILVWLEARIAHKMPIPQDEGLESLETIDLSSFFVSRTSAYA
ncbi:type II toxin-antitoxin system HicB family antitoxin [Candidatus Microgenomates bacterium]|nr:type II toxin-antitoxin system HicB family antitoxin [Candidatus Microgenomates bacterium]